MIETSRAGETVEVVLVNESPREICTVYLSRTGIGYTDEKVATSLPAGSRQTLSSKEGCVLYVKRRVPPGRIASQR